MSTNIENSVVSMSFDNANFERNAKTTMSTLDKLRKALDFSGSAKTLNDVSYAAGQVDMTPLQNGVQEVHNRFSMLEVVAITALSRITNAAIDTGVKVTKALTIDSVMSGFGEYELMMNSVQTIMSGTGESLSTVMDKLNELNQYADDTIYVFSDMTQNIGKFTNAGVKLDTAVAAMKGLSNEAALAGANATEASRAMYNIAQSLSMGYMQYIDWKSIENANMATLDFKQNLVETALEMGTLTEAAVKAQPSINSLFKDKLKDGWLTNDVLLSTLEKYSDNTTELGKKAYAAAQDIKTFSQMWDTLTEAAGSGWSQTFSYILGDFEQAKQLWTGVGNYFGDIIGKAADARNELFKTWNQTGGRDYFIKGLSESFHALLKVVGNVNLAFRDIFKGIDTSQLMDMSANFYYLAKHLNENLAPVAKDIRHTFDGLFAVMHIGVNIITSMARAFAYLLGKSGIGGLGSSLLGVTGNIGLYLKALDETITKNDSLFKVLKRVADVLLLIPKGLSAVFQALTGMGFSEAIEKASDALGNFLNFLGQLGSIVSGNLSTKVDTLKESFKGLGTETGILEIIFKGVADGLSAVSKVIFEIVSAIGTAITQTFGQTDISNVMDFINTAGLAGGLGAFLLQLKNLLDPLGDIGDMIDNIREDLAILQTAVKAEAILKIAEGVALLAVSCLLLASIDADKLAAPMVVITTSLAELLGAMTIMDKFTGKSYRFLGSFRGLMDAFAMSQQANMLVKLAGSILIMATALKIISTIPADQMAASVITITNLLGELTLAVVMLDKFGADAKTGGFIAISTGLLVMSAALKVISTIPLAQMGASVLAVTFLLGDLVIALKMLSGLNPGAMFVGATSMLIIANAMLVLSASIKLLGSMDLPSLGTALLGLFSGLSLVTGALFLLSRINPAGMLAGAASLAIAAGAILVLSGSLKLLATLNGDGLNTALTALCVSLIALTGALLALRTALPGAAALIVAAGAIAILAPSLALLAAIPFGSLMVGLLGLGVALAAIAGASVLLAPFLPLMAGLAGVITLFGVACLAVGGGVALLAAGLATLAVSGVAGATALVAVLSVILGAIPMIVNGIALFVATLLRAYMQLLPLIIDAVILTIKEICGALIESIPLIVETGLQLLLALLTTLKEYLPEIVTIGMELVTELLNGIAEKLPDLIDAAFKVILSFIDGLGQAIEDNAEDIRKVMIKFGHHLWNAFCNFFGIHSPSTKFKEGGKFLIQGLINGITEMIEKVKDKITSMGKAMVEKLKEKKEEFKSVGSNFMAGLRDGIESMRSAVVNKASDIGSALLGKFRSLFDIHSPSKVTFGFGAFLDMGLINGMDSLKGKVANKASNIAKSVLTSFDENLTDVQEDLEDIFDFQPVFKPMIDLSGIQNGVSAISNMLDGQSARANLEVVRRGSDNRTSGQSEVTVNVDNDNVVTEIGKLRSDIAAATEKLSRLQVMLDGKTMVGELAPAIDYELGKQATRTGRGN